MENSREASESAPPFPLIVSHTHKCAGTSLKRALVELVGPDNILQDYGPAGMQDPFSLYHLDRARYWAELERGPAPKVVIGHFHVCRWGHVENATRVTLLRHPIDRLISHYFFWKSQTPNPRNRLWIDLVENDRDILWFANQKIVRFIYTDGYFSGVDMRKFHLIIVYERLGAGLARLSSLFGRPIHLERLNATDALSSNYSTLRSELKSDAALMERLRELLTDDISFYESSVRLPSAA